MPENIKELLTPLAILIWYYDDGGLSSDTRGMRFATQGFTILEVQLLQAALWDRYRIQSDLSDVRQTKTGRPYARLVLKSIEAQKLYNVIKDFRYPNIMNHKFTPLEVFGEAQANLLKNKGIMAETWRELIYESLTVTDLQFQIMTGSLLGLANFEKNSEISSRIVFTFPIDQTVYSGWKFDQLKSICPSTASCAPIAGQREIRPGEPLLMRSRFYTQRNPFFENLRKEWYSSNDLSKRAQKRISPKISTYLTPLVLAVWFLDDASSYYNTTGFSIQVSTLVETDVILLQTALQECFSLESSIKLSFNKQTRRQYWRIVFDFENQRRFYFILKYGLPPEIWTGLFKELIQAKTLLFNPEYSHEEN